MCVCVCVYNKKCAESINFACEEEYRSEETEQAHNSNKHTNMQWAHLTAFPHSLDIIVDTIIIIITRMFELFQVGVS